jgi:hypothetical protein
MSESSCPNDSSNCQHHFHAEDGTFLAESSNTHLNPNSEAKQENNLNTSPNKENSQGVQDAQHRSFIKQSGFPRIIQNFTPS